MIPCELDAILKAVLLSQKEEGLAGTRQQALVNE